MLGVCACLHRSAPTCLVHAVLHPVIQVLDIEGTPLLGTGEVAAVPAGLAAAAGGDAPAAAVAAAGAAAAAPGVAAMGPAAGVVDAAGMISSALCMACNYGSCNDEH